MSLEFPKKTSEFDQILGEALNLDSRLDKFVSEQVTNKDFSLEDEESYGALVKEMEFLQNESDGLKSPQREIFLLLAQIRLYSKMILKMREMSIFRHPLEYNLEGLCDDLLDLTESLDEDYGNRIAKYVESVYNELKIN